MHDYSSLSLSISLWYSSLSITLSQCLSSFFFYVLTSSFFSYTVDFVTRISRPFIPYHFFFRRAFSCELECPVISLLRFSHFNATSIRLWDDTYYTPRPHDNTVDNGNDGCTSLFMPPLPPTNPSRSFCLFAIPLPPARTFLPPFSLSVVRTFEMSKECWFNRPDLRQRMGVWHEFPTFESKHLKNREFANIEEVLNQVKLK